MSALPTHGTAVGASAPVAAPTIYTLAARIAEPRLMRALPKRRAWGDDYFRAACDAALDEGLDAAEVAVAEHTSLGTLNAQVAQMLKGVA